VHNYFTQGTGNNMQINTNVDEANAIGDTSKSQWKLVLGSSLDWFSIRRSPAGGTYNEDALFFIEGSTGNVGIATVDTGNLAAIPFTPLARLDVDTASGEAIRGVSRATSGGSIGADGQSDSTGGFGVSGWARATTGNNVGVNGQSSSTGGTGVRGIAMATTGITYGVYGRSDSTSGTGVYGDAEAVTGTTYGVYGASSSTSGYGVYSFGNMRVQGNFSATGTKAAIVDTRDYGWRNLYAMESPQNWFEDFGKATLSGGEAVIPIEPIFAQTVNLDEDYHVYLTPVGQFCSLYVAEQTASSFTVRAQEGADCEISFHYRIVAPRLDYEDLRLEPAEDPEAEAASLPEIK
jgi:hypothetical protein